jgi:hypothetical protein
MYILKVGQKNASSLEPSNDLLVSTFWWLVNVSVGEVDRFCVGLSRYGQVNEQEAVDREVTYSTLFECVDDSYYFLS